MEDLIKQAIELIFKKPEEAAIMHFALTMDEEMRIAFMLAWKIVNQKDDQ